MIIALTDIEKSLNKGFCEKYSSFTGYVGGAHWEHCLKGVHDRELLECMRFCNDLLRLPPADIFLKARPYDGKLTDRDKQAIGAFWGYVFQFVFGYKEPKEVKIQVSQLKNASYFLGPSPLMIITDR